MKTRTYRLRFRAYPTKRQEKSLSQCFGAVRWVYNYMLDLREKSYKEQKISLNLNTTVKLLPKLKKEDSTKWLDKIPAQTLQQSVIDLDNAYKTFFKNKFGYPKRKLKNNSQSFRLPQPRLKFSKDESKGWILIPNFKDRIRFDIHRKIEGKIKGVTVIKDKTGKYYVSLVVISDLPTAKPTTQEVGIDLGIKDFAVFSNGEKIAAPKFLRKSEKKLKRTQRSLSRKKRGSNNRKKARLKLAKIHEKISNQRSDFLHKLSRKIVDENQVIAMETLKVKNMVKNRKLSKSISDSGWGMFVSMVKYKSEWYNRSLKLISQWEPSTKRCSECKLINNSLTLADRYWKCACGAHHDRDINAAKNILNVGRDTPDFKPVEKLTSVRFRKKPVQVGSVKQESKILNIVRYSEHEFL